MIKSILIAFTVLSTIVTSNITNILVYPTQECSAATDCINPLSQYCNHTSRLCYYKDHADCYESFHQCITEQCIVGRCISFYSKTRKYGDTCVYATDCEENLKCQVELNGSLGYGDVKRCLKEDEYRREKSPFDEKCLKHVIIFLSVMVLGLAGYAGWLVYELRKRRNENCYAPLTQGKI